MRNYHRNWMKLTQVIPINIIQSCETYVFQHISSIHHIIMLFFEKYVRIKIEDHEILVLISKLSLKSDKVNASYPCKYNSVSGSDHSDFYDRFKSTIKKKSNWSKNRQKKIDWLIDRWSISYLRLTMKKGGLHGVKGPIGGLWGP